HRALRKVEDGRRLENEDKTERHEGVEDTGQQTANQDFYDKEVHSPSPRPSARTARVAGRRGDPRSGRVRGSLLPEIGGDDVGAGADLAGWSIGDPAPAIRPASAG